MLGETIYNPFSKYWKWTSEVSSSPRMENIEKCKSHMRSGEYMCLIEIPGEIRNENGTEEIFE